MYVPHVNRTTRSPSRLQLPSSFRRSSLSPLSEDSSKSTPKATPKGTPRSTPRDTPKINHIAPAYAPHTPVTVMTPYASVPPRTRWSAPASKLTHSFSLPAFTSNYQAPQTEIDSMGKEHRDIKFYGAPVASSPVARDIVNEFLVCNEGQPMPAHRVVTTQGTDSFPFRPKPRPKSLNLALPDPKPELQQRPISAQKSRNFSLPTCIREPEYRYYEPFGNHVVWGAKWLRILDKMRDEAFDHDIETMNANRATRSRGWVKTEDKVTTKLRMLAMGRTIPEEEDDEDVDPKDFLRMKRAFETLAAQCAPGPTRDEMRVYQEWHARKERIPGLLPEGRGYGPILQIAEVVELDGARHTEERLRIRAERRAARAAEEAAVAAAAAVEAKKGRGRLAGVFKRR
ncbi:hypothetical protein EG329_009169 [Mollisiaceae sp. DMI_Dod_QoI]|nr:hypothetical protein EG329_009169 [Helotiales sp. DMI_Dod_QoI]